MESSACRVEIVAPLHSLREMHSIISRSFRRIDLVQVDFM